MYVNKIKILVFKASMLLREEVATFDYSWLFINMGEVYFQRQLTNSQASVECRPYLLIICLLSHWNIYFVQDRLCPSFERVDTGQVSEKAAIKILCLGYHPWIIVKHTGTWRTLYRGDLSTVYQFKWTCHQLSLLNTGPG